MNLRRAHLNTLMLAATLAVSPWVGIAHAKLTPNPAQPQFGGIDSTLELASRRRFRLGSRSSRYRVGGFRRGGSCLADGQTITPLVPPLPEASPDAATVADDDVPVDVTTEARPVFFVHVPELTAPTTVQFTLQDEFGTEELTNLTFDLPEEDGVIGLQPLTLSKELDLDEIYYWQMAVQCNVDSPDENPVINGWILRTEQTADLQGTVFEQAATLAEEGIWQDAVTLLAQARLNAPNDAAAAADWQALMEGVGLSDFADEPVVEILQQ